MKIEIAESLVGSWLKHVKMCKIIQTSWKPSNLWDYDKQELLQTIMQQSNQHFLTKYNLDLFKKTNHYTQLLKQAEIDVLGIEFKSHSDHIYAVDVAFHESGVQYGSKDATIAKILQKIIRTALCLYTFFNRQNGTIIFATPKAGNELSSSITHYLEDVEAIFREFGFYFDVQFIANEDFYQQILNPVNDITPQIADTMELFIRSSQLQNLFSKHKNKPSTLSTSLSKVEPVFETSAEMTAAPLYEPIANPISVPLTESSSISPIKTNSVTTADRNTTKFEHLKIGEIVRTIVRDILQSGKVSAEEIELLQTKSYCKQTFDIQYPLLVKAALSNGISPKRYYSQGLTIRGERYFLCSEWYEVPSNNDRPYLLKWINLYL